MRYPITRNSAIVANKQLRIQGTQKKAIMGENILSVNFESFEYIDIKIGDRLTFLGEQYTFKDLPNYNKVNNHKHQYSADLKGRHYDLANYSYFNYNALNELIVADWSVVGNAEVFLDLLIRNANRDDSGWVKGDVAETEAKLMTFSGQTCLSALTDLAIEFDLEWWIEGQTISLRKKEVIVQDITFEYGKAKGLRNFRRQTVSEKPIITRLFVFGGSKNLPPNYRSNYTKTLQMPIGIEALEKNIYELDGVTVKYGVREQTIKNEDIFPRRTGAVTSTTGLDEFSFFDTEIDFNINDQLLPGTTAKITFQTGQLAGYTFDINSFDNATKKITFNENKDETAFVVPSLLMKPLLGDEYVLFDIEMPNSYVLNAELELQEFGEEHLNKNCEPQITYAGDSDMFEAKRRGVKPILGRYIKVKDPDLLLDKNIRVNSTNINIENEWDYSFELNDTSAINSAVLAKTETEKRVKQIYKNAITSGKSLTIAQEVASAAILQQFKKTYVGELAVLSGAFVVGNPELGDIGFMTADVVDPTDVIFGAGSSYAARATAPFRVTLDGSVYAIKGVIGGFYLDAESFDNSAFAEFGSYFFPAIRMTTGDDPIISIVEKWMQPLTLPKPTDKIGVKFDKTGAIVKKLISNGLRVKSVYNGSTSNDYIPDVQVFYMYIDAGTNIKYLPNTNLFVGREIKLINKSAYSQTINGNGKDIRVSYSTIASTYSLASGSTTILTYINSEWIKY